MAFAEALRIRCVGWAWIGSTFLYLHDAEDYFQEALGQGYPALAELRDEGLVGAIGAGMGDAGLLARLVEATDVDVVMLAGRYTLLDESGLDQLLPVGQDRGVSVVAAAVFNSGVLAQRRPAAGAMYGYGQASPNVLKRANRIAEVCAAHGVTLPQAAMAFPLTHPVVAGIVVGMRSAEEVRQNLTAFATGVSAHLWNDLRSQGLLDERVPVTA
jgi:D-threo-aldose 1-dehydrogenase